MSCRWQHANRSLPGVTHLTGPDDLSSPFAIGATNRSQRTRVEAKKARTWHRIAGKMIPLGCSSPKESSVYRQSVGPQARCYLMGLVCHHNESLSKSVAEWRQGHPHFRPNQALSHRRAQVTNYDHIGFCVILSSEWSQ